MIRTPPALAIEPRTDAGTGLTVPIAKALAHFMLIHEAATREWPLTTEMANAELSEGVTHLGDVALGNELFTDTLINDVVEWMTATRATAGQFVAASISSPESMLDADQRETLQGLIRNTWSLLALVDRELTGRDFPDPGRRP